MSGGSKLHSRASIQPVGNRCGVQPTPRPEAHGAGGAGALHAFCAGN